MAEECENDEAKLEYDSDNINSLEDNEEDEIFEGLKNPVSL